MVNERFVLGFDGAIPTDGFLRLIEEKMPGGVIVFERNFRDMESLVANIDSIKSASPNTMILIDQEGGQKSRLRKEHGFPNPPDPRDIPEIFSPKDTENVFYEAGRALRKLGIEVDLAPVADIAPDRHFLGKRSFSDDPRTCALYGESVIEGLLAAGILPCAKHFPGLGSATLDPHIGISVSSADADFENIHLLPFRKAVEIGVPAIMTTHLIAKGLDPSGDIATVSRPIIQLIRKRLGFEGVIISDDLLMGGSTKSGSVSEIAIRSLRCGHDMILICSELPGIVDIIDTANDLLSGSRDNEDSISRVRRFRSLLPR